ncbi:MAG: hypothetical protein J6Z49_08845 [Kiritimatiellae bacterium]|nr:hypothetical protein [Kiritimatiellia bacterium]
MFRFYLELKNVCVAVADLGRGVSGWFASGGAITLDKGVPVLLDAAPEGGRRAVLRAVIPVCRHEMRHAIQYAEELFWRVAGCGGCVVEIVPRELAVTWRVNLRKGVMGTTGSVFAIRSRMASPPVFGCRKPVAKSRKIYFQFPWYLVDWGHEKQLA